MEGGCGQQSRGLLVAVRCRANVSVHGLGRSLAKFSKVLDYSDIVDL